MPSVDRITSSDLWHRCWYCSGVRSDILRFASLHPQLFVVLALEFLNSFRDEGLSTVFYNYATNEFNLSDSQAGTVLAVKGLLDCVFGLAGSILVDLIGVRRTTIYALSVAVVGRSLLSFGRSHGALYSAAFLFSPAGEALLGIGLYKVALKKLTTPRSRTIAFSVSYAVVNFAGGCADLIVSAMRTWGADTVWGDAVFTPTRKFAIVTLLAVTASLVVAVCFLEDLTVADVVDPEDDVPIPVDAVDAKAMFPCASNGNFRYKVFKTDLSPARVGRDVQSDAAANEGVRLDLDEFISENEHPTIGTASSLLAEIGRVGRHLIELFWLPQMWRVLVFGLVSFPVCIQWNASTIVLMPYLERLHGESVPIYAIHSINFWGCTVLPPIVGVLTASIEDFQIVLPGLTIMALSPLALLMLPTVGGACLWQVWLTIGEVFWAPRIQAWTASLAPTGKEGLFFALVSLRYNLFPVANYLLGLLNERYNPNCPNCRDQYGHFCEHSQMLDGGNGNSVDLYQCVSVEDVCEGIDTIGTDQMCPRTCQECPGYESNVRVLWMLLLATSLLTPVLVCLLLPFFRGDKYCGDLCFSSQVTTAHRAGNEAAPSCGPYETVTIISSAAENGTINEDEDNFELT